MAQEFLHRTNVIAIFEQVGRKAVSQRMATASLLHARLAYGLLHSLLQRNYSAGDIRDKRSS